MPERRGDAVTAADRGATRRDPCPSSPRPPATGSSTPSDGPGTTVRNGNLRIGSPATRRPGSRGEAPRPQPLETPRPRRRRHWRKQDHQPTSRPSGVVELVVAGSRGSPRTPRTWGAEAAPTPGHGVENASAGVASAAHSLIASTGCVHGHVAPETWRTVRWTPEGASWWSAGWSHALRERSGAVPDDSGTAQDVLCRADRM
jgi:hypothetical protein